MTINSPIPCKPKVSAKSKTMSKVFEAVVLQKPKRALTAYNIFTGFERERIINGTDKMGIPATPEDAKKICAQHKIKKRRQHRKSHGLISFQELSKIIAQRWKELPEDQKQIFENQAEIEKAERQAFIREWKIQERKMKKSSSVNQKAEKRTLTKAPMIALDSKSTHRPACSSDFQSIVSLQDVFMDAGLLNTFEFCDDDAQPICSSQEPFTREDVSEDISDEEFTSLFDSAERAFLFENESDPRELQVPVDAPLTSMDCEETGSEPAHSATESNAVEEYPVDWDNFPEECYDALIALS